MHRRTQWLWPLLCLIGVLVTSVSVVPPAFADFPNGIPLSGKPIIYGSTNVAELDGNTANGKEIVVGGSDGVVYAYGQDGNQRWATDITDCDTGDIRGVISSAPAIGDLDGNGSPEVVVGYGGFAKTASCSQDDDGGVVALSASGQLLWRFATPFDTMNGRTINGVVSSPGLSDVDNNGKLEIGFGSFNNNIYLLNSDGSLRWRYRAYDTIWSSPAFADLDGDKIQEMIIGSDWSPGNRPEGGQQFPNAYGWLYAFKTAAETDQLHRFGEGLLWRVEQDQSVFSSPAVADLDGDGSLEVVVGTGTFHQDRGKNVKIYNANGTLKQTLSASGYVASSPAIGDLNNDGKLDVVAAVYAQSGGGSITAWSIDRPNDPLWSVVPRTPAGETVEFFEHTNSPVLADLDGNGSLEVVVMVQNTVLVLRNDTGQRLHAFTRTPQPNRTTPTIANLDNDPQLEVTAGGSNGTQAVLYTWDIPDNLGSPTGTQAAFSTPWATFRGNAQHTGLLVAPKTPTKLVPSNETLNVVLPAGQSTKVSVTFQSDTGTAITWTASESDPNNIVALNRTNGSSSDPLEVTVSAPTASLAQVQTLNATITIQSPGLPALTIPVRLTVGTPRSVFVPFIGL